VASFLKVLRVIEERRSIRQFDSRPVEQEKIDLCVEAAHLAPSADNVQPWRFVIFNDPDMKEAFGNAVFTGIYRITRWALKAPVLVMLLADLDILTNRLGRRIQDIPFYLLDLGIAGEHFVLQAQALGLGTCWIGWFHVKKAHRFLKLPRGVRVCALLALGYSMLGYTPNPRKRRPLEKVVFYNQWGNTQ
jgi:nitroreductase